MYHPFEDLKAVRVASDSLLLDFGALENAAVVFQTTDGLTISVVLQALLRRVHGASRVHRTPNGSLWVGDAVNGSEDDAATAGSVSGAPARSLSATP